MADPNDTLDPEPVDAEFEPADDSGTSGKTETRKGPGWTSLVLVFLLASTAGGAIGWGSTRWLAAPAAEDLTDTQTEDTRLAALDTGLSALETRLARLENPGSDTITHADIDALAARIGTLETADPATAPAETVDLSAIEARLAALETARETAPADAAPPVDLTPLEDRLDALEHGLGETGGLAQQALDAAQSADTAAYDPLVLQDITRRLAELETARANADAADSAPDPQIAELQTQIASLAEALEETRALARSASSAAEGAAQAAASRPEAGQDDRRLAARVLALTALRDVAATGDGFEAERAALARLWRDNADISALDSVARAGVPATDQLAEDFPGQAIRDAAGTGRVFFGLIEVRQSRAAADSTGAMALTALAEDRLADGDLDDAVALAQQLEGEALAAARDWLISARARQDLDRRLARMRQALADDAAALGTDPS